MLCNKHKSFILLPWQRKDKIDKLAFWLIPLILIFIISLFFLNFSGSVEMYFMLKQSFGGSVLILCSKIMFSINLVAIIWRVYIWKKYKPIKITDQVNCLSVSILVSAYNEEKSIYSTIASIIGSDYPKEKIQIIIIDDGSTDGTYCQIEKALLACHSIGVESEVIHYKQNRGKRFALYQGFEKCRNEIVVTLDSDSIILSESLEMLVKPFICDENIGTVAGNVKVMNHQQGIIPRMLDISFNYSFDFIRSGQSYISAVLVTPGALSAYRTNLVNIVKDKWLNQTFLGVKVRIGEDRALNNFIVALGYESVFQKDAHVFTNVPICYTNLCKMYLRWARSNIRETVLMTKFVFKPFRKSSKKGLRSIYFLHLISLTFPLVLKIQIILALFINPLILIIQLLAGSIMISLIPFTIYAIQYKSRNAFWAFIYSIFYLFSLWWIIPYAVFTLRNNNWLTKK